MKRMNPLVAATALAVCSVCAYAEEAPAASPLTFNVGVVSDYMFRGISQTHHKPALQAGADYAFASGFYVGAWGSNISWVKDAIGDGSVEVDLYGGYKGQISNDLSYDLGVIAYLYPGHGKSMPGFANPNTTEVYGALTWKWLTAKYSYAASSHFVGWEGGANYDQNTRGSNYIELNANYDMGDGWGLVGHVGHQKVKNSVETAVMKSASYSDWKVGVTKDVGFGVVGLAYSDTNVSGTCSSSGGTNAYCWGTNGNGDTPTAATSGFKNAAKGVAMLSFNKTF